MSESDDSAIEWSKTTFEGSRREQVRRWRELTVRQRLEALDRLSDLAGPLGQRQTGRKPTVHPPQADVHAGAIQEASVEYGTSGVHDVEPADRAPKLRKPRHKKSAG